MSLRSQLRGNCVASRSGVNFRVRQVYALRHRRSLRQYWDAAPGVIEGLQLRTFRHTWRTAHALVPYYSGHDCYPAQVRSISDFLSSVPIITKTDLRDHNQDFMTSRSRWSDTYQRTSGSTGIPLLIRSSVDQKGMSDAVISLWRESLGLPAFGSTLFVSGFLNPGKGDVVLWSDFIGRRQFFSIYRLSDRDMKQAMGAIMKFRPRVIQGYPSAIVQMADIWASYGAGQVAVLTSCESLTPGVRAHLEASFGAVYDYYGSQEGAHLVHQCTIGTYHTNPFVGLVEICDEAGRAVPTGAEGRVVVTSLRNDTMPLIRYDLGDTAVRGPARSTCECGSWWPELLGIQGRSEDLVRTSDGRAVGYLAFHVFKEMPQIEQGQIHQSSDLSLTVRVVLRGDTRLSDVATEVENRIHDRTGPEMRVTVIEVSDLPKGAGGKVRAVTVDPPRP